MLPSFWLGQASPDTSSLPPWWPIAAVVVPLIVAIIVAFIQMSGAVKSAKIAAEAKEKGSGVPPEAIAEEVARVLGVELDKRLGTLSTKSEHATICTCRTCGTSMDSVEELLEQTSISQGQRNLPEFSCTT